LLIKIAIESIQRNIPRAEAGIDSWGTGLTLRVGSRSRKQLEESF